MDAKTIRLILRIIHEHRDVLITLLQILLKCKKDSDSDYPIN